MCSSNIYFLDVFANIHISHVIHAKVYFHTNAYLRMCFMQIRIFQMCYVQIYLSKENARMVKTEEQEVLTAVRKY